MDGSRARSLNWARAGFQGQVPKKAHRSVRVCVCARDVRCLCVRAYVMRALMPQRHCLHAQAPRTQCQPSRLRLGSGLLSTTCPTPRSSRSHAHAQARVRACSARVHARFPPQCCVRPHKMTRRVHGNVLSNPGTTGAVRGGRRVRRARPGGCRATDGRLFRDRGCRQGPGPAPRAARPGSGAAPERMLCVRACVRACVHGHADDIPRRV